MGGQRRMRQGEGKTVRVGEEGGDLSEDVRGKVGQGGDRCFPTGTTGSVLVVGRAGCRRGRGRGRVDGGVMVITRTVGLKRRLRGNLDGWDWSDRLKTAEQDVFSGCLWLMELGFARDSALAGPWKVETSLNLLLPHGEVGDDGRVGFVVLCSECTRANEF